MGNRAIIKTEGGHIGLYLHWNGGRDNGAYIIRNWEIVGRECYDGPEQNSYDLWDMLREIDKRQPEADRLGAYLESYEVPTEDLKIGDVVTFIDWSGEVKTSPIIGIGEDITVNGTDVKGLPFMNLYGSDDPEHNINNYIREKTARVLPKPEESPVEIYINEELRGIELKFKSRPSDEVRAELKASGWKWHHKKAVWYAKNDPAHMEKAQQIAAAATK